MTITHVRQDDRMGCGIACAAMVAGMSYQQVRKHLVDADYVKNGLDHITMPQLLLECKVAGVPIFSYNPLTARKRLVWPAITSGTTYIVAVQTRSDTAHFVVLQPNGQVLDPGRDGICSMNDYLEVHYLIAVYRI